MCHESCEQIRRSISKLTIDGQLLTYVALTVLTSALIVFTIKVADRAHLIHFAYFVTILLSASLGVLESRKGWVLAGCQAIFMLIGYYLLSPPDTSAVERGRSELEAFVLYGSIILTFVASLLGGFVKRALSK